MFAGGFILLELSFKYINVVINILILYFGFKFVFFALAFFFSSYPLDLPEGNNIPPGPVFSKTVRAGDKSTDQTVSCSVTLSDPVSTEHLKALNQKISTWEMTLNVYALTFIGAHRKI